MIPHAEYHKRRKKMKEKYSVFVSILHMDEYYSVESWPEEGSKAVILQGESVPGGSVSNAACVFSALGGKAAFYDVLSKSSTNDFLLNDLKKSGVCIDYVSRVDGGKGVFYYVEGDDPFYSRENNNVHITPAGDKICFEYNFGEGYTEKRYWTIDEYEDFAGVYSEDNDVWDD